MKKIYDAKPEIEKEIKQAQYAVSFLEKNVPGSYAFVTIDTRQNKTYSLSSIQNCSLSQDHGVVFRVLWKGCNFEWATNNLTRDSWDQALHSFVDSIKKKEKNFQFGEFPAFQPPSWEEERERLRGSVLYNQIPHNLEKQGWVHFGTTYENDLGMRSVDNIFQYLGELKQRVKNVDKEDVLSQIVTQVASKLRHVLFVDRERIMSQTLLRSLLYMLAFTKKGRTARTVHGGLGGDECTKITEEDIQKFVKTAYDLDEAEFLKAGHYKVMTGPDVTGVIAHEAFGHTQEGDSSRYGRSCAPQLYQTQEKVGNKMASIVNNAAVFDMAGLGYGQNGSHFFDDEGYLASEHYILKEGFLCSPMNDLLSALKTGSSRQSNGKRESWRRPIMSRQTNTYFTDGDYTFEELLKKIDYGFIAEVAHGGMEDPKGMRLTAGTDYLREVVNGKLTGKVFIGPQGGHVELNGYVPDLLKGIIGKTRTEGNDNQNNVSIPLQKWGGCGKYHKELVEAGSGGPWILWADVVCG